MKNISSVTYLRNIVDNFYQDMSFFTKAGNVHINAWKSNKYYMFWVCICSLSYPVCAILSSVACPSQQYFSSLSHKRHDFREREREREKKKLFNKNMCFDFLYIFCLIHFSFLELSEIWSKMYIGLHVKYLLFLSDFIKTLIFLEWF